MNPGEKLQKIGREKNPSGCCGTIQLKSNLCSANSIVVTPHSGAHSFEFEKEIDENSATGGHRFLSPIDVHLL